MNRRILVLCLFGFTGIGTAYNPCASGGTCRIMPLGDSITWGTDPCNNPTAINGNGYRYTLFQDAVWSGWNVTFVSSGQPGSAGGAVSVNGPSSPVPLPTSSEGHPGYQISQADPNGMPLMETSDLNCGTSPDHTCVGVLQYIDSYLLPSSPALPPNPDIILVMLGANDIIHNQGIVDADGLTTEMAGNMSKLLTRITTDAPNALVVVATLIPSASDDLSAKYRMYNAKLPAVVQSFQAQGKHVTVVDMYSALTSDPNFRADYFASVASCPLGHPDTTHPLDAGYAIMGHTWYSAIAGFPYWASQRGAKAVVGDFDGDLKNDIALVSGQGWASIPVAFSNGDGTFKITNTPNYVVSSWTQAPSAQVIIGNFDNDVGGAADIGITGVPNWSSIPVGYSAGNGSFPTWSNTVSSWVTAAAQVTGVKVLVGDYRGHHQADLEMASYPSTNGTMPMAFADGAGGFPTMDLATNTTLSNWTQATGAHVFAADFDGDTKTDIAVIGVPGWTGIQIGFSSGDGTFQHLTNVVNTTLTSWAAAPGAKIVVGDFDGDQKADIGIIGGSGYSNYILIGYSHGVDGSFVGLTEWYSSTLAGWAQSPGAQVLVADFDNDRLPSGRHNTADIAITGVRGWPTLPVAFSNGDGSFRLTNF